MPSIKKWTHLFLLALTVILCRAVPTFASEHFHSLVLLQNATFGRSLGLQTVDLDLVQRLVTAYRNTFYEGEVRGQSMWAHIYYSYQLPLHQFLMTGNTEEIANLLSNPITSNLHYGFETSAASLQYVFDDSATQNEYAIVCLDYLLRCAEAMGALDLDHPETHPSRPYFYLSGDEIIERIEGFLGQPLIFPNLHPDECGLITSRGVITHVTMQTLYQAWRIKQLVKDKPNARVLEIGAGLGRTAHFARQLGIADYTIVDLPLTALSSGYFLGSTLGADRVQLAGEKSSQAEPCIKFLTPTQFLSSDCTYDLIINANGFTEMEEEIARAYWEKIGEVTPLFVSMNHEANSYSVNDLINSSQNVAWAYRTPYWMHPGYVEELVRFKSPRD